MAFPAKIFVLQQFFRWFAPDYYFLNFICSRTSLKITCIRGFFHIPSKIFEIFLLHLTYTNDGFLDFLHFYQKYSYAS